MNKKLFCRVLGRICLTAEQKERLAVNAVARGKKRERRAGGRGISPCYPDISDVRIMTPVRRRRSESPVRFRAELRKQKNWSFPRSGAAAGRENLFSYGRKRALRRVERKPWMSRKMAARAGKLPALAAQEGIENHKRRWQKK